MKLPTAPELLRADFDSIRMRLVST